MHEIDAKKDPKCQVPSIIISILPLYLGGTSSSIAANIAVYSPPTPMPVKNLKIINK